MTFKEYPWYQTILLRFFFFLPGCFLALKNPQTKRIATMSSIRESLVFTQKINAVPARIKKVREMIQKLIIPSQILNICSSSTTIIQRNPYLNWTHMESSSPNNKTEDVFHSPGVKKSISLIVSRSRTSAILSRTLVIRVLSQQDS